MPYLADSTRYENMQYRRSGRSGLKLPAISLGLWQNFGAFDSFENGRAIVRRAFDAGITHFDLANNYGPPHGSAEENFGQMLAKDLRPYRDELVVSTKAGYGMWAGPYGNFGSRKYLLASLDQSLQRLGLEYVDIFYHHRPDPDTPLEETMGALAQAVHQGKALYAGISNYEPERTAEAAALLREMGVPCLIHQPRYNMNQRWIEDGLLDVLEREGIGCIPFSPLDQGFLTSRYLGGNIPDDSRAGKGRGNGAIRADDVSEKKIERARRLNVIAEGRGQTLAQMALAWILRLDTITSVLIGASRVSQLEDNLKTLKHLEFSPDELEEIDGILRG
ncbi:MAG: L-glyceraldehyde 3-phosphate reductase [Verrucomicrobiota bacterium JB022]|nr:L-glyceraldehyde 3-phosphate reductase [Verrucomicrobiota bacterium JB022]